MPDRRATRPGARPGRVVAQLSLGGGFFCCCIAPVDPEVRKAEIQAAAKSLNRILADEKVEQGIQAQMLALAECGKQSAGKETTSLFLWCLNPQGVPYRLRSYKGERTALVLWDLLGLFGLPVLGQLLAALFEVSFVPPMEPWHSGLQAYPYLTSQVLIIALLIKINLDFAHGQSYFSVHEGQKISNSLEHEAADGKISQPAVRACWCSKPTKNAEP